MWNPTEALPEEFLAIPSRVYEEDPLWHPEDSQSVAAAFSAQNPYFSRNRAWIGIKPDKARLAGFFNPDLRVDNKPVAYFGYWESMDEVDPNQELFAECERWAKEQGAARLYGPINFTTFSSYRIRLNAFEYGYFPSEPYNLPYYQKLLEAVGYSCSHKYFSHVSGMESTAKKVERKRSSLQGASLERFSFELMDGTMMARALPEIYGLVESIFGDNFGYTSIPLEALAAGFVKPYARRLCPRTSVMCRSPEGEVAAVLMTFPDYGPLVEQRHPEAKSLADITFDSDFDRLEQKTLLLKSVGVSPNFRKLGLYNKLLEKSLEQATQYYTHAVAALISEGNPSARFFEDICDHIRWYGLFVKELD